MNPHDDYTDHDDAPLSRLRALRNLEAPPELWSRIAAAAGQNGTGGAHGRARGAAWPARTAAIAAGALLQLGLMKAVLDDTAPSAPPPPSLIEHVTLAAPFLADGRLEANPTADLAERPEIRLLELVLADSERPR